MWVWGWKVVIADTVGCLVLIKMALRNRRKRQKQKPPTNSDTIQEEMWLC